MAVGDDAGKGVYNDAGGPPKASSDDKAGAGSDEKSGASTPSVGPWHIVGLLVIVIGIVLLVLILRSKWNEDTDTVTGVLAVIIPAFATVGAAIFGATVAYSAGKSTGESAGKAEGEANKDQAVKEGKKELAAAALKPLRQAQTSVDAVVSPLSLLPSPANNKHFLIDSRELVDPIALRINDINQIPAGVQAAVDRLEEELQR